MTYGQYTRYPDYQIGMCKPVTRSFLKKGVFRKTKWQYSHLRTFYAGLFQRIKLTDLLDKTSKFFRTGHDLVMMWPMLEMARDHAYFSPEVNYVYNYSTPLNDAHIRPQEQLDIEAYCRKKSVYQKLTVHPKNPLQFHQDRDQSDLIIFSYNRPMQLYACLESIQKYAINLGQVFVIYRSSNNFFHKGYHQVKEEFPFVTFIQQPHTQAEKTFKPLVMQTSFHTSTSNYITYCVDDIILKDTTDWKHAILQMQRTDAYGFYFRLGKHLKYCYMADAKQEVPDLIDINENTFAWRFKTGSLDWNYPNNVDLTLYKKSTIKNDLSSLKFTYPNDLEGSWATKPSKQDNIGLCYSHSKMINIPLNVISKLQNPRNMKGQSPEEMNKLFLSGYKIDIQAFHKINNISAHLAIQPNYIKRGHNAKT